METKHTRTPFTTGVVGSGANDVQYIYGEQGRVRVAQIVSRSTTEEERRDAEFIVQACNSYDANQAEIARLREVNEKLVAALKDAEFLMRKLTIHPNEIGRMIDSLVRSSTDAATAVKLAKEAAK